MQDNLINATSPSRRSIAKGAAWALPALTVAGVAPSLAASTLECSAASQQAINNAITLVTTKTAKLQANFYQPADAWDGAAQSVYLNLRNIGSTKFLASPSNPIVVEVTLHTANPNKQRGLRIYRTDWGTLTRGDWANGQLKLTWTITEDVPVTTNAGNECDMRLAFVNTTTPGKYVHATAVMTSFGVNDDLKTADFPALSDIVGSDQVASCQDYYDAQVQANLTANYTLLASGKYTSGDGIDWPVGTSVSSRDIGNGSPLNIGYATNGVW